MIWSDTFIGCKSLKSARLPDGLVEIGFRAFRESGLESIAIPPSVRVIHQSAFCGCRNLKKVTLNEGLEVLGTNKYPSGYGRWCGVFDGSALEHIDLPLTLKRIEYNVFRDCRELRRVKLPDGLEYIGKHSFAGTGLESVKFPASLR